MGVPGGEKSTPVSYLYHFLTPYGTKPDSVLRGYRPNGSASPGLFLGGIFFPQKGALSGIPTWPEGPGGGAGGVPPC